MKEEIEMFESVNDQRVVIIGASACIGLAVTGW